MAAIVFPWREAYLANWKLPFQVQRGWCWLAVGGLSATGLMLVTVGVGIGVFAHGIMSSFVEICRDGFRFKWRTSAESVPWKLVTRIQETIFYERPPLLKWPASLLLPKFASASYLVFTATDKSYPFDGNSVREIKRFGEVLRRKAEELSVLWETVEDHD